MYIPNLKHGTKELYRAIDEKIQVLRDFYIVNKHNEGDIRNMFEVAVRDNPNKDIDVILDRVAKKLITDSFDKQM